MKSLNVCIAIAIAVLFWACQGDRFDERILLGHDNVKGKLQNKVLVSDAL